MAVGLGVVPPVAVGPCPAAGVVVQFSRRVHGRRHVRAPVRQADVRNVPRERVLRHSGRAVVLRVRLHALRRRHLHRAGRGAGRSDGGEATVQRLGACPIGRRPAGIRLGVPRTVAGQCGAGRGQEARRPGGHARAHHAHRRSVRSRLQPTDAHRGGHVRRLVRRTVGRHRMEVRDCVRVGQSVRNSAHQPPLVSKQVSGLPPRKESHHTVRAVIDAVVSSCG